MYYVSVIDAVVMARQLLELGSRCRPLDILCKRLELVSSKETHYSGSILWKPWRGFTLS
jgi:hypothetical protein